jgi:hypothetical protein
MEGMGDGRIQIPQKRETVEIGCQQEGTKRKIENEIL